MAGPGNACGASASRGRRQRTAAAGSAASAMRRARLLRGLAALMLVAGTLPTLAADGRTPLPKIEPAVKGGQCVEPSDLMRRQHMNLLKHQRDDTVFGGIRGAKHSLKDCVVCHASPKSGSVAAAPGDFCVSCHSYAAVRIDCFECHTGKPAALAARAP